MNDNVNFTALMIFIAFVALMIVWSSADYYSKLDEKLDEKLDDIQKRTEDIQKKLSKDSSREE